MITISAKALCISVFSNIFFPSCSLETELGAWQKHAFMLSFKHDCLEAVCCYFALMDHQYPSKSPEYSASIKHSMDII